MRVMVNGCRRRQNKMDKDKLITKIRGYHQTLIDLATGKGNVHTPLAVFSPTANIQECVQKWPQLSKKNVYVGYYQ